VQKLNLAGEDKRRHNGKRSISERKETERNMSNNQEIKHNVNCLTSSA